MLFLDTLYKCKLFFRSYVCPLYAGYYLYMEYGLILIFSFNVLYYVFKLIKITVERSDPILITKEQKKLLGVQDAGLLEKYSMQYLLIYIYLISRSKL